MNKTNGSEDLVTKGFHRLDPRLLEKRPPKINWGPKYKAKPDSEKIVYLEKLAAAMNHAAHLIQTERNALGELCEKKEQQLVKMAEAMAANNEMLQTEVTKMNEQRQGYNAAIARLNQEIRTLKNDHNT